MSSTNFRTITDEPTLGRSVTIERAAELLKLSRRTIYYRIRDGRLQTVRTLGGSQRVLMQSLFDEGVERTSSATAGPAVMFGVSSLDRPTSNLVHFR